MRCGLLKNFGPTQIFPIEKQQRACSLNNITNNDLKGQVSRKDEKDKNDKKSKSVNTFGVEQREFYDKLRLKGKEKRIQNQNLHKPIFKLKGDNIVVMKQKDRELYPADIQWNNGQIGRIQGEISGKIDKNYAKIRRYLEGSSSVIDYSDTKMYDKFNSYSNIVNQERFSKDCDIMFRTSNNAQPGKQQSIGGIIRSKYEPDWIQRGKYQ
ncbi:unnamed protein product [Paramecium sonneborni]|uniref:Uncharacterized protein n=1 Tax=Paramecium sonneborni TaxID=65129 RepID=A0A8S1Q6Z2_9CILI|nr:unnamed protein product [Paramecium sonneborni]